MIKRNLFLIGILSTIIYFVLFTWRYTYYMPFLDDFDTPIRFLIKFTEANSWKEKFGYLFEFHADHRLLNLRLEVLIFKFLFGSVNLQWVTLFNNLFIVIAFFMLTRFVDKRYYRWDIIFIMALFLFSQCYFPAINWAHVSANYGPVVVLSLLGLFLFNPKGTSWFRVGLIFLLSTFALFSFGNGIMSYFCYFFLLLYSKQFKKAAAFAILALVSVKVYFIGYQRPEYLTESKLNLEAILAKIAGFVNITGGFSLMRFDIYYLASFIGLGIIGLLIHQFYINFIKKEGAVDQNIYLWGAIVFIYGTLMAITHGRVSAYFEITDIFIERYRFYSVLGFVTLLAILYNNYKAKIPKIIWTGLLIFGFLFNLFLVADKAKQEEKSVYKKLFLCTENNFINHKRGLYYYQGDGNAVIEDIEKAQQLGIIDLKGNELTHLDYTQPVNGNVDLNFEVQSILRKYGNEEFYDKMFIARLVNLKYHSRNIKGAYLVLLNPENKPYLYPFEQNPNQGKNKMIGGVGGVSRFNLINLPNEAFEVKVLVFKDTDNYDMYSTDQFFDNSLK